MLAIAGLLAVATPSLAPCAESVGDVFDPFFRFTFDEHKVTSEVMPNETVDPFTGTLRIVQEDVYLPGKAGHDLRLLRTYSSKIWGRADLQDMEPLLAERQKSALGYGWSMHMGRLHSPNGMVNSGPGSCNAAGTPPAFEAPDGTWHVMYPGDPEQTFFVSKDFWRMETACPHIPEGRGACVWSDRGVRYDIPDTNAYWVGMGYAWSVSDIVDPHGNRIHINYVKGLGLLAHGELADITDTYQRRIEFSYEWMNDQGQPLDDGLRLTAVTVNPGTTQQRIYRYHYTTHRRPLNQVPGGYTLPGERRFLSQFQPPAGASTSYDYAFTEPVARNQYALTTVIYPHGGTSTYQYDAAPFFTGRETLPFSVVTSRTVSGRGIIPGGGTWTYKYDSPAPDCTSTSCPIDPGTGSRTTMHVTSIRRPDGRFDTFTIIGFGYLAANTSATKRFAYAVGLNWEIARGDRAVVERFSWGYAPRTLSNTVYSAPVYSDNCGAYPYVYDDVVHVPVLLEHVIQQDKGTFVTKTPDNEFDLYAQPLLVNETGYLGYVSAARPLPPQTRSIRWSYLQVPTDPSSHLTLNLVRGRPTSREVKVGEQRFRESWEYDPGQHYARTAETKKGIRTTFEYYPDGDLHRVTNALGLSLRVTEYQNGLASNVTYDGEFAFVRQVNASGWVDWQEDGRGHRTVFEYDKIGRVVTATPPGSSDATFYDYAPGTQPDGQAYEEARGPTRGAPRYTKLTSLDGIGRPIAVVDSLGVSVTTHYDAQGQAVFRSYPWSAVSGEVGDRLVYDGLGRVTEVTKAFHPDDVVGPTACEANGQCRTRQAYFANCVTTGVERRNAEFLDTIRCHTSFGDPGEQWLNEVGDAAGNIWTYGHNADGTLATVAGPVAAGSRSYEYFRDQDGLLTGLLKSETTGERGTITFEHNELGQPRLRRDGRPVEVTYGYRDPVSGDLDPLSRLRTVTYKDAPEESSVRWYEPGSNNLQHIESQDGGIYDYVYDELNRLRVQTWTIGGWTYTTSYTYDAAGCLTRIAYPTGSELIMTCDAANRVQSVTRTDGPGGSAVGLVNEVTYHPTGQVAAAIYPGYGGALAVGFDDQGRTTSISEPGVLEQAYRYDGAGNTVAMCRGPMGACAPSMTPALTRTMAYDALDRLTEVAFAGPTGFGSESFGYDALGNLLSKDRDTGLLDYHYDDLGRMTSLTGAVSAFTPMSLTWNKAGMLAGTGSGEAYRYDALGRRVAKTAGAVTYYHHDAAGRVIAETDAAGQTIHEYYYLGAKLLATHGCSVGRPPCTMETEWYHTDILGSVLARSDASTPPELRSFDYRSFGEQHIAPNVELQGDRQYNGRVYDASTGFHDYGARMYWPEIGRFISADSVMGSPSSPMTLNRYSYVLNNPYKYVDPDGRQARRVAQPPGQFLRQQRLARFNTAAEELQQRDPITRRDFIAPEGYTPTWEEVFRIEAQVNTLRALQGADLPPSPIDRRTWKSERGALWKLEARTNPGRYSKEQLEQMARGQAPTGSDGKPMEWHHVGQRPESPKEPMTQTDHRIGPNFEINHPKR